MAETAQMERRDICAKSLAGEVSEVAFRQLWTKETSSVIEPPRILMNC